MLGSDTVANVFGGRGRCEAALPPQKKKKKKKKRGHCTGGPVVGLELLQDATRALVPHELGEIPKRLLPVEIQHRWQLPGEPERVALQPRIGHNIGMQVPIDIP